MRVAIITAIYDDYDTLKPFPGQEGVECAHICVTDKMQAEAHGWQIVVEPRPFMHPNIAAKRPKTKPWNYTAAEVTIWLDASFAITSPHFARDMASLVRNSSPIAQFKHPWRDCVYDEAEASKALAKYQGLPIDQQMDWYRNQGHVAHWGLWATGIIVRSRDSLVAQHGEQWLLHCQEWGFQDQLSEAPLLNRFGLRAAEIPGTHLANEWLQYQGSGRH